MPPLVSILPPVHNAVDTLSAAVAPVFARMDADDVCAPERWRIRR